MLDLSVLAGPAGAGLTLRQGEVTQVSPLLVQVGAAATATPATALGSYVPVVGDVITLLEQGPDRVALGPIGDTEWTTLTLSNSWVDYGAGFIGAGYRKVGDEVQLRGLIKNGTLSATAATLPTGHRPVGSLVFASSANGAFGNFFIHADGTVVVYAASNAWFSINCSFPTS